jgi:N-acetylglucosaminyldiphosphoundecaprenol N-acetyl-beta-D-mannosaminyltransferase
MTHSPQHQTEDAAKTSLPKANGLAKANVLDIEIDALDMAVALERVGHHLHTGEKGYICVAGVHGVMEAQRDPALRAAYAGSALTVPDGTPLVWVGRLQGNSAMGRVAGPDLMLRVFAEPAFSTVTHFLYGGDIGVVEELRARLQRRFAAARIVGIYTPPFRDLTLGEEHNLIATIRELKPQVIWVGIGCPRQELFMARYLPLLETTLIFGVGAAFDYHTGRIRDSAQWVKTAGLQWLHRLVQDPRRLWRRYLFKNPAFVWKITLQLLGLRRSRKLSQASPCTPCTAMRRAPETKQHHADIRMTLP